MNDNMEKADKLIELIDNELLKLYEVSMNKGDYSHFNFKQALLSLNDEFLKNGLFDNNTVPNIYYKNKTKDFINVFNDLCNYQAESISTRFLSCDKDSKELEIEQITIEQITYKHTTEIRKVKCDNDYFEFISNFDFPEKKYTDAPWTCKFEYLLRGCNVNYDRVGKLNRNNEDNNTLFYMDNLELYKKILSKEDNFDNYFGSSISIHNYAGWNIRYKFSFEEYVKSLQDKRIIDMSLENKKQVEINHDEDEIKQIESLINIIIPRFISNDQRADFKELLMNGRVKNKSINIKGKYSDFHAVLFPYKNLIPTKFTTSWYDLIANNFTRNGKSIPKTTISNPLNND
jgi:hypothetical protein